MSAKAWKIMLGVYLLCLLALIIGVIMPRLTTDNRAYVYGMAVLLGFLGLYLAKYFFRK